MCLDFPFVPLILLIAGKPEKLGAEYAERVFCILWNDVSTANSSPSVSITLRTGIKAV